MPVKQERFPDPDLQTLPPLPRHKRALRSITAVLNRTPTSGYSLRVLVYIPSAPSLIIQLLHRHHLVSCLASYVPASFFSAEF